MSTAPLNFKGIVHGKTIELERDTGLPDGQAVAVSVLPAAKIPQALLDSFGAWADEDDAEFEEFLKQVYRDRDIDPRNESPA